MAAASSIGKAGAAAAVKTEAIVFRVLAVNGQEWTFGKPPPEPPQGIPESEQAKQERLGLYVSRIVPMRYTVEIFCARQFGGPVDPRGVALAYSLPMDKVFYTTTVTQMITMVNELIPEAERRQQLELYGVDEDEIRAELLEEVLEVVRKSSPTLADELLKTFAGDDEEEPGIPTNGTAPHAGAGAS